MLGLIYSVLSYIGFLATFVYLACFSDGVIVPKTVNHGVVASTGAALAVNASLLLLFGVQHSVMARSGFKRALVRIVPESLERATYVLASNAALCFMMWRWRPLPQVLWSIQRPGVVGCLWAVNAIGWLGVPLTSLMIDHFDLVGVKQAFAAFRRKSATKKGFVTPLLYKYMRHPMMVSLFIAFWVTPHMTIGHLVLSAGMTAYILVGVHFEERSLARELGAPYERYQASTPKFLPRLQGTPRPQTPPVEST